jgi:hypothetical protein
MATPGGSKTTIISSLVEQLKTGAISKSDLFEQLAQLQQQRPAGAAPAAAAASTTPASGADAASAGTSSTPAPAASASSAASATPKHRALIQRLMEEKKQAREAARQQQAQQQAQQAQQVQQQAQQQAQLPVALDRLQPAGRGFKRGRSGGAAAGGGTGTPGSNKAAEQDFNFIHRKRLHYQRVSHQFESLFDSVDESLLPAGTGIDTTGEKFGVGGAAGEKFGVAGGAVVHGVAGGARGGGGGSVSGVSVSGASSGAAAAYSGDMVALLPTDLTTTLTTLDGAYYYGAMMET